MNVALAIAFVVVLLIAFFFYGVIFPALLFIDCIKSERSKLSKVLWAIVMFIFWPLPHFIYGVLYLKSFFKRMLAGVCLAITLLFVVGAFLLIPRLQGIQISEMESILEQVQQVEMPGTLPDARDRAIAALRTLQEETGRSGFLNIEQMEIASNLNAILEEMIRDNQWTSSEYQSWIEKFRTRQFLDHEALEDFLEELR